MKVAALLDDSGMATSPQSGGTIYIFHRDELNWVAEQKLEFRPDEHASMEAFREYVGAVCDWLGDCKVVAAGATTGYYRVTFGSFGVALWAVKGTPESFIEQVEDFYIKAEIAAMQTTPVEPAATIEPIPDRPGHYRLDLREAMAKKGAHNSRQVLLPFFRDASFARLELICDHVPRWFDRELPQLDLRATVESQSEVTRVHVYPVKAAAR